MKTTTAQQLVEFTAEQLRLHYGPGPHADGTPQSVHGGGGKKSPSRADPDSRPGGPVFTPEWKRKAAIVAAGPATRQKVAEDFNASRREFEAKRYVAMAGDLTQRTLEKRKKDIATLAKKSLPELRAIQATVTSQIQTNASQYASAARGKRDTTQIEHAGANLEAMRADIIAAIDRVAFQKKRKA